MTPSKVWTDKDGTEHAPVKVGVLTFTGSRLSVEYEDSTAALAALGGWLPERLAPVALPVFVQGAWDAAAKRRGPVFFRGRSLDGYES